MRMQDRAATAAGAARRHLGPCHPAAASAWLAAPADAPRVPPDPLLAAAGNPGPGLRGRVASRFPAPAVRSLARAMAQAAVRDRAKCPPLQAKREFTANRRPASERTRSGRHASQRTRPGRKPRDKTPNRGPKRLKNRLKNMAGYLLYLTPGSDRARLPQTAWSTLGKGIRGQALSYGDACSGMWLGLA